MHAAHVRVEVGDAADVSRGGRLRPVLSIRRAVGPRDAPGARRTCAGACAPEATGRARRRSGADIRRRGAAPAPGGTLVVLHVHDLARPRIERQIQTFLDRHPELEPIDLSARFPFWRDPRGGPHLLALPHVQGSDGFFIAAFRRRER